MLFALSVLPLLRAPLADAASPTPLLLEALVFVVIVAAMLIVAGALILFLITRHRKRSKSVDKTDVSQ